MTAAAPIPEVKAPRKVPPTFEQLMDAFMAKHGFVDYAVVAISADGTKVDGWAAGDGEDEAADEARISALGFGLSLVEQQMKNHCLAARAKAKGGK